MTAGRMCPRSTSTGYRGPDRRTLRAVRRHPLIAPSVVVLGFLTFVLAVAAWRSPDSWSGADAWTVELRRLDAAAGAVAILAGMAAIVRWRVDGTAPAFWAGIALVVLGIPGIVDASGGRTSVALFTAAGVVAIVALAVALTSPEIDTGIRPLLVATGVVGAVVPAVALARGLVAGPTPEASIHAALAASFGGLAGALALRLRRDPTDVLGGLAPALLGVSASAALAVVVPAGDGLHDGGPALLRTVAMALTAIAMAGDLHLAAAVQRTAAHQSHRLRDVAEHRRLDLEARVAETLHEVRSTVVALEGGVRRLDLEAEEHNALDGRLARALVAEIERLRSLVSVDPSDREVRTFCVRDALEPMLTVCHAGGIPVRWRLPRLGVRGEPADLAQVVHGLVTNAVRHAPGSEIEVTARRDGSFVLVEVCDRGPGVPHNERELIFDRGARGEGAHRRDGQGLGLYIARSMVRAHDGELWVEPREGGGARFVVALPADAGARTVELAGATHDENETRTVPPAPIRPFARPTPRRRVRTPVDPRIA